MFWPITFFHPIKNTLHSSSRFKVRVKKIKKTTQESNQIEKYERVSKKVVSQLLVIFYLTKDTKFRII